MPPRKKAAQIPDSPSSSTASSPAPSVKPKARTSRRKVVESEDDDEDDELALEAASPPPAKSTTRAKPKPRANINPPSSSASQAEPPRRRSGRTSGKGVEEVEPSPPPKKSARSAPPPASPPPPVEDGEEDEQEADAMDEDETDSLLAEDAVEDAVAPADEDEEDVELDEQAEADPAEDMDDEQEQPPAPAVQQAEPAAASQPQPSASSQPKQANGSSSQPPSSPVKQPSSQPGPPPPPPEPKGPQKRLIISKMVLENFKSYAGRQEIGPFHKSFSAIVGPNGSGKSNTIDALLFVFGYRAAKMRQGKLSELIHNSEAWPNLDYCKVEVWFKEIIDLPGPDAFKSVPNSELIVARTAYKDNKSKYSINERTSNYTEVTTLLKDRGIDLTHKRFLILQGEVESIAQMKPKAQTEHEEGLLEYLEDIIGTSKYKTPIEEALVEVDGLNEVMGEKKGRLGIVVRELNGLKSRKKEAEDYLRDQNELVRRQSMLYQFHIFRLRRNIDITEQTMEQARQELAAEVDANKGNLAEIDALTASYNEQNAIFQDVVKKSELIMKELVVQEKKQVQLEEKKKHAINQQKKLKKSITDDGHARSNSLSWIENHDETIAKSRKELDRLEAKLVDEEAEFESIRDGLKDKTAEFSNQIEIKQQELEPWTAKISEKQAGIDVATSERDLLVEKASGMREGIVEAESALEKLREGGQEKVDALETLVQEKTDLEEKLVATEKKISALGSRGEELRSKASTTRARVDEAKASLAASKGEDAMLSGLKKLSEMGRLSGFHGRLGDLGVIDDKYDVAVTTACGGALNSLVTDNIEQGQAVIEHLRRTGGRANIFVLDKLPSKDLGPLETPENVPRLFDLIKPRNGRLAAAFFKATGNTLVADTLEQANRIAYGKKRWRVVTLGGDLIDVSGAMSGGGTRVQRGGMSSKFAADRVEPQVIAKYEKESVDAQQELTSFQDDRKKLEEELAQVQRRMPQVEIAISKIELDVQNGQKRVAEAERRVAELKAQSKPNADDEKRIAALDKDIAALTKDVEKLRSKSSGIEEAIKALQEQILQVGGVRLRSQKSKVDGTKQQIDLSNEKITRSEVEQTKARKDAEKAEKAIASNTTKLEEIDEQLEQHATDLATCTEDLDLVRETLDQAQHGREDLEEDLNARKTELDDKQGSINSFRARELELNQKIAENQKIQKDSKNKFDHWTDRHGQLELQYIEEDDEEVPEVKLQVDAEGNPIEQTEEAVAAAAAAAKNKQSQLDLEIFSEEELEEMDRDVLTADVANLEERVGKSKPNMAVLAEYRKRQTEFDERQADLDLVTANRDSGKKRYDDLRQTRHFEFMAGFNAISSKLKEMYQLITLGGLAELELVDSLDPFSEGIIFSVMPPKKSWKNISNLSGGEKTLSSLALVFALHVFKPTPLYFMDEIDAALDFRNVSIIANYIRERTKSAQFIIISLRSDMFELSHRLVGIYKTNNATKSISIDNSALIPAKG